MKELILFIFGALFNAVTIIGTNVKMHVVLVIVIMIFGGISALWLKDLKIFKKTTQHLKVA